MDKSIAISNLRTQLKGLLNCDIQQIDITSLYDSTLPFQTNHDIIIEDLKQKGLIKAETSKEDIKAFADDIKQLEAEEKEREKAVFTPEANSIDFKGLFNKPKIIGVIGDVSTGKSMLLYHMIYELKKFKATIYTYGLKRHIESAKPIYSIEELEQLKNSVVVIDEYYTLFELENRKMRRQIENCLRLICHNNNIIILVGVSENFKKFIGSKIDTFLFKRCKYCDFINGSRAKSIILSYRGLESGATMLDMPVNEVLIYDYGKYSKANIPYIKEMDTKLNNKPILQSVLQNVPENVQKKVSQNVL